MADTKGGNPHFELKDSLYKECAYGYLFGDKKFQKGIIIMERISVKTKLTFKIRDSWCPKFFGGAAWE